MASAARLVLAGIRLGLASLSLAFGALGTFLALGGLPFERLLLDLRLLLDARREHPGDQLVAIGLDMDVLGAREVTNVKRRVEVGAAGRVDGDLVREWGRP